MQSFRTSAMKTNMQISTVDPVTNMIKNMHGASDIANSVFEDTLLGRCISEYESII